MARKYNYLFSSLVKDKSDIQGHIAYAIYKFDKISYLDKFKKVTMFANANEELRPLDIRSRGLRAPCREAPPRCFSWFL